MVIIWFLVLFTTNVSAMHFLVFGGNGNIGSAVVFDLLQSGHIVTTVNRGNWFHYYDAEIRIKPFLHKSIVCDRYNSECNDSHGRCNPLKKCEELINLIDEYSEFYVLDFSAYEGSVIEDAIEVLKSKVKLYVYISSDSVYEVSAIEGDGLSVESDAIRPDNMEERKYLNERDPYGDGKLQGEEALFKARVDNDLNYVILRLPDVYGPRDSTNRWWPLQLYVKYYDTIRLPFKISKKISSLQTSWIYVNDVSDVIQAIIKDEKTWNDVYNLGSTEYFNLATYLKSLSEKLGVKVEVIENAEEEFAVWLPSVYRGPVDITKVKSKVNFEPTSWKIAMEDTVKFYEKALVLDPHRRRIVLENLLRIFPEDVGKHFLEAVNKDIRSAGYGHEEL